MFVIEEGGSMKNRPAVMTRWIRFPALPILAALLAAPHSRAQSATPTQVPVPCDESNLRPPVTEADVQIAKRAQQLLDSPQKWNRADNRVCPAGARTLSLYCALEKATDEVSGNFEHRGAAMQEARFVIEDVSPKAKDYDHRLMGYNNDLSTTFADIQNVLRLLESRIAKRLKEQTPASQAAAISAMAACGPPPITSAEIRIVKRVREILDSPSKWDRASSQECPTGAQTFGLYCAFAKATAEIKGSFDGGGAAIDHVRNLIDHKKYPARLVDYNNDPAVRFADMQKLLQAVEDKLSKQLADAPPGK
jgi:hypothetical protein